ncbi:MAG: hypothetical protein U1E69_01060 [Tabrizicola sp.]|uniref:hypothetical protein n=1 Tax=Tabrizicola sp. TaxID=2005166 RepID=UPI002AB81772|nr:hypothetical protein [Tabrizicola sp.]MDZ4085370.1 hypothetical protein [Tabrizicola sp.]
MALAVNFATTSDVARRLVLLPVLAFGLTGCASGEFFEDVQRYGGPDSVIAKASDSGADDDPGLVDGEAAIAYDPDGCQVWIIDDGVEGYSSPRFDPATGLPICDGKYPPGTVLGPYETSTAPGPDYVPR